MEVQFVKISPTQNMTILVENPVPRDHHPRIASALMDYSNVYGEQVGFIESPASSDAWARLQMMGGEFCGNATMSLAAFLVWQRHIDAVEEIVVPLEVSGADELIRCRVRAHDSGYRATVAMPSPKDVCFHSLTLDGREYRVGTVRFPGIAHLILPTDQLEVDAKTFALRAVDEWGSCFDDDAQGFIFFDRATMRIDPLIHVKSASSLVWERGCGSGTAALGAYLAAEARKGITADIAQPGGVITVGCGYKDEAVTGVTITGGVSIAARGTAYI